MSDYVGEIESINRELKKLKIEKFKLWKEKERLKLDLYVYMKEHKLNKFKKYTLKALEPKPILLYKTTKEKKAELVNLFRNTGINDPEKLLNDIVNIQKPIRPTINSS